MAEAPEIYVLDKTVRLRQPAAGFRTSLDSVMLAAACPAKTGERVLDLGCGVGGASFCVLRRVAGSLVTGIDILPQNIDLAKENIGLNEAEGRCDFLLADVKKFSVSNMQDRFDHVICNPPYLEGSAYTPSPDDHRAAALGHIDETTLQDWLDAAFHALQSGGSLTLIHRADAVDRIVQGLGRRFGALELIPFWPRGGEAAKRIIVRARKDRKTPATVHAGIVLHKEDGSYTPEAERILRQGEAI